MKTGIVTIYDLNNYGNRLQNYALHRVLSDLGASVVTVPDVPRKYEKSALSAAKHQLAAPVKPFLPSREKRRYAAFEAFTKRNIPTVPTSYRKKTDREKYRFDACVVGSDQVWNPFFSHLSGRDTLESLPTKTGIAYAASFGVDDLPEEYVPQLQQIAQNFSFLSVREASGKRLLEKYTDRKDIEVLVDPALLLTPEEWGNVSCRPKHFRNEKYLLLYFLGSVSEERRRVIDRFAEEIGCQIVEPLRKESEAYTYGPGEFLWCVANAECVLTDSYHGSIFSFLYDKPLFVFDREDGNPDMSSRLETLLSAFGLEDRNYTGELTKERMAHDYSEAFQVLEKERMRAHDFLSKALSDC